MRCKAQWMLELSMKRESLECTLTNVETSTVSRA